MSNPIDYRAVTGNNYSSKQRALEAATAMCVFLYITPRLPQTIFTWDWFPYFFPPLALMQTPGWILDIWHARKTSQLAPPCMSVLVSKALSGEASERGNKNQREQKTAQQCGSYGIPLVYLTEFSCAKLFPVVCLVVFVSCLKFHAWTLSTGYE